MQTFKNAHETALALRPDDPVYCFRPQVLKADARRFMELFPGKTAYAVKTNGEELVLKTLAEAGIDTFDVASPAEFAAVRSVGLAGSVPLVLDEPFAVLDDDELTTVLDRLARLADAVQIVLVTDREAAVAWAAQAGSERALVRSS